MTIIKKLWNLITKLWNNLDETTHKITPIAIAIVQGVKNVMDSPVDDILISIAKQAIPGDADDILIDKVKSVVEEWIPKILFDLNIANAIANIDDPNLQLQAILDKLKLSSSETQNIFFHGLGSLILEKLSDGKLSWSDSTAIAEYYYKNVHQQPH